MEFPGFPPSTTAEFMSIPKRLTPQNCAIAFIDYQPQMLFGVASHSTTTIISNTIALAKSIKVFDVPVILSTLATKGFNGHMIPQLTNQFPTTTPIERSRMNACESANFRAAVENTKRKKLLIAGLWTEICVAYPALEAMRDGFEIYVIADVIGGSSKVAHDTAMTRMLEAGAIPVTWQQVLLEFQLERARQETDSPASGIVRQYSVARRTGAECSTTVACDLKPVVPIPELTVFS